MNTILDSVTRIGWCLALVVVFVLSIGDPSAVPSRINDKLAHFLVFLVLGIWALYGWRQFHWSRRLAWLLVFYGIAIEIAQYFVPGRYFSIADWSMDILGVVTAVWLFNLLLGRANR